MCVLVCINTLSIHDTYMKSYVGNKCLLSNVYVYIIQNIANLL